MKKASLFLISLFTLLLFSCSSWMKDDNLYSDIENDVKVANAARINVYVRYAMTRQGKTDPDGTTIFKVGIPQQISATTETEYGFVRWAAFSTSYLATGDNQSKNKDFIFKDEEDYNTRILPNEIVSPAVVFEDATNPTTKVIINERRDDIFIVPVVTQRPAIELSIPASGTADVVRNMAVRISFSKPMDPESFKNSDNVYDKITVTQGTQTISAGEIEISSEDITDHFQAPIFSANGKMITLKFTDEAAKDGYASKSSVQITISKEVKDKYGFEMVDDGKITFTAGSSMDTYAPRIKQLTAGPDEHFGKIQGMYKDNKTVENVGASTEIKIKNLSTDKAPKAKVEDLDNDFYVSKAKDKDDNETINPIIENRVKDKVFIRVVAEDISQTNNTGIETDVALVGIRAKLVFDKDGNPVTSDTDNTISLPYVPQENTTSIKDKSYQKLVEDAKADDPTLDPKHGCLYEYDLSGFPDGLIQIDVAAVDGVSNNGFAEFEEVSKEYGNGYASLFVVKDTTPPAPLDAKDVQMFIGDNSSAIDTSKFYNETDYRNIKISVKTQAKDTGHPRLGSQTPVKWIVKPAEQTINTSQDSWKDAVPSENFGNLTPPSKDTTQKFIYALMDDLGNISTVTTLPEVINYDCTKPVIGTLKWIPDSGYTEGIVKGNVLNNQTLEIPITEATSGLNDLEVSIKLGNATQSYTTPFGADGLKVLANDEVITDISINNNTLTFSTKRKDLSSIKIKGLKLAANTTEGNYTVSVKATDAAGNNNDSKTLKLYNDSTEPKNVKVFVPNVKKVLPLNATSSTEPKYWINANNLGNQTSPKTDIYVTFKENGSGPKVFDFTGSTFTLSSDSQIYKVDNLINQTVQGSAIGRSISGNVLTIDSKEDAAQITGDSVTVKITNVALYVTNESYKTSSSVKLKISDVATNIPNTFVETMESKDDKCGDLTDITSIEYDRISLPQLGSQSVKDRKADKSITYKDSNNVQQTKFISAVDRYTNEIYVDGQLTINSNSNTETSIYAIKISGNAVFEIDSTVPAEDRTKVYDADNNEITDVIISEDTITFWDSTRNCYKTIDSEKIIQIKNIKLTNPETNNNGYNVIKFNIMSACERKSANAAFSQIFLDTTPPVWNTSNSGLYMKQTDASFYPRSAESNEYTYGLVDRVSGNTANDIFFYTRYSSTNLGLYADVTETGSGIPDNHIYFTNESGTINSYSETKDFSAAYSELKIVADSGDNKFTACVIDKAGNVSEPKTFHIVKTTSMNSGVTALEHNSELIVPQGIDETKNTFLGTQRALMPYNGSNYKYSNEAGTINNLYVYNYVLKKKEGYRYQLRVKLSDYSQATKTKAPIEKYYITHLYSNYPGTEIDENEDPPVTINHDSEQFTPIYNSNSWHAYIDKNGNYSTVQNTDLDVVSTVDSNGDIIITLPDGSCPPLTLYLMDGCGNYTYVRLNPKLKETLNTSALGSYQSVGWVVDGTLPEGITNIQFHYGVNDVHFKFENGDTYYFKGGAYVYKAYSDESLFANTDLTDGEYSIRALIYAGERPSDTVIDNFAATDWTRLKFTARDSNSNITVNLPHNIKVEPTKLWYIVEDRVGNRKLTQITSGGATKWQYDDEPPSLEVDSSTIEKINTFGDTNYWSDSSTVSYSIVDTGSGIKNDGLGNTYDDYKPSVDQSETSIQSFFSTQPDLGSVESITIDGVVDQIGNSVAAESLKIKTGVDQSGNPVYAGKWVKLGTPNLSNITTTLTPVPFDDDNNVTEENLNLTISGNTFTLKPIITVSKIKISLTGTATEGLMGFIVRDATADLTGNFYEQSDVVTEYLIQKKDAEGNEVNDEETAWKALKLYLYPVNKAGLASSSPITIDLKEDPVPAIKSGYFESNNYIYYDVATSEDTNIVTAKLLSPSSTIGFETSCDITSFKIYDKRKRGTVIKEYSTSGKKHTITFEDTNTWKDKTDQGLYLQLDTGTQVSIVYKLVINNDTGTSWTYDKDAPTITSTVVSSNTTTIPDDDTYYVTDATVNSVTITVTAADETNGSGILEYQIATDSYDPSAFTTNTNTAGNNIFTITPSTTKKNYYIRVMDKAGNVSTVAGPFAIQIDTTPPNAAITAAPMNGASEAGTGYYHIASSDTVTNIFYNSENVSSVKISVTGYSDAGVGLPDKYLSYKAADRVDELSSATEVSITGSSYEIDTSSTGLNTGKKAYRIFIKDKLGNSKVLGTYVLNGGKPTGTVSYTAVTGNTSVSGSTIYFRSTGSSPVSSIELTVSNVKDSQGADASLYYTTNSNSTHKTLTVSNGKVTIPCPTNTETYNIYASDGIGNTKLLKTYTLNGAVPAGTVSYTAETGTSVSGSTIYFKSTGSNPVTSINLTSTVKNADGTDSSLWYKIGNNDLVQMSGTTLPCPDNENKEETYKIFAKDSLGNISAELAEFTLKGAAPTGSITSYAVKNGENPASPVSDTASGDYILSSSGTTDSIIYNPDRVNKITVNLGTVGHNGSGASIVVSDGTTPATYESSTTYFDINFDDEWTTEVTYSVVIKDAVGNETLLKTFKFKPHGTAPVVQNKKNPYYSGLHYVPTYPYVTIAQNPNSSTTNNGQTVWTYKNQWIQAFTKDEDAFSMTAGSVSIVEELKDFNGDKPKIFGYNSDGTPKDGDTANTEPNGFEIVQLNPDGNGHVYFQLPVYSLPSEKVYYAITYNSIVPPTTWTKTTVITTNGKSYINNIPIDLTDSGWSRHTIIFVWYKDELGNISVHNLTDPGDSNSNRNWFTTEAAKGNNGDVSDFNDFEYAEPPQSNPNIISGTTVLSGLVGSSKLTSIQDVAASTVYAEQSQGIRINKIFDNPSTTEETVGTTKAAKKAAKKAVKKAAKATAKATVNKAPEAVVETITQAAADVAAALEVTELPVEQIAVPAVEDQTVTKQIEPQASVTTSLVETAAADYEEAPQDNLVLKLVIALAVLVLCGAFAGIVFYLKKKRSVTSA